MKPEAREEKKRAACEINNTGGDDGKLSGGAKAYEHCLYYSAAD